MISLDKRSRRRVDLVPGVVLEVEPVGALQMGIARAAVAAALAKEPDRARWEAVSLDVMGRSIAQQVVVGWDGFGVTGPDGKLVPVDPTPDLIDEMMRHDALATAFMEKVIGFALLMEAEKNASAPSPTGTSGRAGARPTAPDAQSPAPARSARAGRSSGSRPKAPASGRH